MKSSRILVCLTALAVSIASEPAFAAEPQLANGRIEEFVFKKTKDKDIALSVHFPEGWKATDKRPAIVFFFGGAWAMGSPKQFIKQAEYFASRGMVVARADYRVRISPVICVEDAKSAVRWMRSHAATLGIDPERIVGSGGSAGGHLAAVTGMTDTYDSKDEDGRVSSKPNLLVLFNPVLDMEHESASAVRELTAEEKRAISPMLYIRKDTPPSILFYGERDGFFRQGREFVAKSKKVGNEAILLSAPDQGHGFFNGPLWLNATLVEVDRFLIAHKYLTGEPTVKESTSNLKKEE